jgi:hypothetical protein
VTAHTPTLLFLYGPPAVGKLTVARAVAARRSFRILHNHVTLDAVSEVLDFGSPAFWEAVSRLREDLVASAAREGLDLIFTFVYAPTDEPHVARIVDAFERHGGRVTFVQLVAPKDELLRRVSEESRRAHGKITDQETLLRVLDEHDVYQCVERGSTLTLDVASLSAADAADQILEHLDRGLDDWEPR